MPMPQSPTSRMPAPPLTNQLRVAHKRSIEMKKTIFYTIAVVSAVLLAKKFVPSLIRELKQEFM
jgi:hypothetical protein